MTAAELDVMTIGNAIVDIIAPCEDTFLEENGLQKGSMTLIDQDTVFDLYDNMSQGQESSGGSAANTAGGLASLGAKVGYIGKINKDQFGMVFRHDLKAIGVEFKTEMLSNGPATAQCLIHVTPDAQRTMTTYLGACLNLTEEDILEDQIASAKITYMEGYLWDPDNAKQAFLKAARLAHKNQRKVSLSLSDSFCVERHRDSFMTLVKDHIDILFANEDELKALYQTDSFDEAVTQLRQDCSLAAVTRGKDGSVIINDNDVIEIAAYPTLNVVDTTGAGDLYAAGVLYGLSQGAELARAGFYGSIAASEIIGHFGARPQQSLSDLLTLRAAP